MCMNEGNWADNKGQVWKIQRKSDNIKRKPESLLRFRITTWNSGASFFFLQKEMVMFFIDYWNKPPPPQ